MKTPPKKTNNNSTPLTPNEAVKMVSNAIDLKIMITNITSLLDETEEDVKELFEGEEPNNVYFINRKFDVEYFHFLENDIYKKNPAEVIAQFHKWARELETIIISNKELIVKSKIMKETFEEQLTKISLIMHLVDEIERDLFSRVEAEEDSDINPIL